ncbi:MAG: GGDEF domain-containing protein [Alphaproteobacteria bacterium]|nr:GGDEF domain-containing protein [Alphaproteobacteria bacterium]
MSDPLAGPDGDSLIEGPATTADERRAVVATALAFLLLAALTPFAARPEPAQPLLAAADCAWTVLSAVVTALLLVSQDVVARRRGVAAVAIGYLLLALLAGGEFLLATAPGADAPRALGRALGGPGAGAAGLSWPSLSGLSLIRSFVLSPAVLVYVALGRAREHRETLERARRRLGTGDLLTGLAVCLVLFWGAVPLLILVLKTLAPALAGLTSPEGLRETARVAALLDLVALGSLIARRDRSRFDLWLFMATLGAFCEVTLLGLFSAGPFDLGWYGASAFGAAAGAALLVVLLLEGGHHVRQLREVQASLVASNRALEHQSLHDSLTGLANRRYFDAYLERQIALSRRNRRDLALVLCDLDDFKLFNDRHGHQAGDECLARIAAVLQTCARRPGDMAARYGGEEFALILPETDLISARRIAEAAREAVARLGIPHYGGPAGGAPVLTLSGGLAVIRGDDAGSAEALVAAADAALFRAKNEGRDRIVVADAA